MMENRQLPTKAPPASMDLQARTLRVSNYGRQVTSAILKELFSQGGPVRKIVFKDSFSFIEFDDEESVGYCLALFDGIELFGDRIQLSPKINKPEAFNYLQTLKNYEQMFASNPLQWWSRFGDSEKPCPSHICTYSPGVLNYPKTHYDLFNNPNNPIAYNQMMMNQMMNNQMNNQMMNNQMNNQMMPTSSSYTNLFSDVDLRMTRDSWNSSRDFGRRSSGNQFNRNDNRRNNDRNNNDRNNNEKVHRNKKFDHHSNQKRPHTSSNSPNKRRKHQSF